ncbi:unnamed protein product [Leptosia nina]|uniref:Uncharacterized protein n=1 Tax=Leptosia nina TaxID=320188 RepID=A0AAV1K228_9NEOP
MSAVIDNAKLTSKLFTMDTNIKSKGPIFDPGQCRCCNEMKKCRLLNVEYNHMGQKEIYSDMFLDCFGLVLSQLDGEAKDRLICAMCVSRLREANNFRKQVLQCEEKLLTVQLNDIPKSKVQLKKRKKLKKRKVSKEIDSEVTEDMLMEIQRMDEKLEQMQHVDPAPEKMESKSHSDCKAYVNTVTIVENSYVCPFDTSFSDYFCVYCRGVFTNPHKLREHTLTHDPRAFREIVYTYSNNKKVQLDIEKIDCRLCPEEVDDLDAFKRHITSHGIVIHDVEDEFLKFKLDLENLCCLECGKRFSFFHALKKHMAEHFGTCICDVCGAHYFEERMLVLHQKTHQRNDEVFNCKECGKSFKSKYTRYIHIARTHKKEAAYLCSKCDQVFFSYTLRYRHMIDYHGVERLFKCDQCDRSYDSRKSLREHNRRSHLKIRRHACMLCDKRFYLPSRLKEHMASHNGERNFRCEYCGKSYPRLRGLKVHMQSHSMEKKYKCMLCNAAFTQNFNLKSHMKRQHGGMDVEVEPFLTPVT